eukprot:Skav214352  [mRNA]  locus=scaffold86:468931:470052:+ [translate_table: standard]
MTHQQVKQEAPAFNATISACEKGDQWEQALSLFEVLKESRICPTVISYSATISACEKSGQWQQALNLFHQMPHANVVPDVHSYSATISACEKGGQWQRALNLFDRMPHASVRNDVYSYNATISACEKGSQWQWALRLFETMQKKQIQATVTSYNATITACQKSGQWQRALSLFERMRTVQVEQNYATYNAILDSPAIYNKDLGGHIFQQGPESLNRASSFQNWISDPKLDNPGVSKLLGGSNDSNAKGSKLDLDGVSTPDCIDLHGLSEGAARLALGWWLSTTVADHLERTGSISLQCIVVTGYGKSRRFWHESDVQQAALDLLHSLKLHAEVLSVNKGRVKLCLRKEDLPVLRRLESQFRMLQIKAGAQGFQ